MGKNAADSPEEKLAQGRKIASGAGGAFSRWLGSSNKEDGYDKMIEAANAFRAQGRFQEAGAVFAEVATAQEREQNYLDAAQNRNEAFKTFRQVSPLEAAENLERAIKLKKEKQGNISQAARYEQTLAELFEQELEDLPKARATYKAAADDFDLENTKALADRMWRKYAELSALAEDYYAATERFVFVAKRSLESNLMRWGVKEDLLKAGICQLATGDLVGARQKIEQYQEIDSSFPQQRECALLMDVLESVEKGDPDMFSEKLFQYDQMSKLDKWKTTILLRIKQQIEQAGEDFS